MIARARSRLRAELPDQVVEYLRFGRRQARRLRRLLLNAWIDLTPSRDVPVVTLVFRRPQRLPITLSMLERQRGSNVRLYIWNNNPEIRDEVDEAVRRTSLDVHVHHSEKNVAGFGQYALARDLADRYDRVVLLDDDEDFDDYFVSALAREFRPRAITAYWAWILNDPNDYFDRTRPKPGGRAKYCGTGGIVCPTEIFRKDGLFQCPDRYRLVWDLWLSYYAQQICGWKIYMTRHEDRITLLPDEHDISRQLVDLKNECLRYLVGLGWDITISD